MTRTLQEALAAVDRCIIFYTTGQGWSAGMPEGADFSTPHYQDRRLDRAVEKELGLAEGSIAFSAGEADAVSEIENAPLERLQSVAGADYRVFVCEWWPQNEWSLNGWLRPLALQAA